jgi:hypothetical protein
MEAIADLCLTVINSPEACDKTVEIKETERASNGQNLTSLSNELQRNWQNLGLIHLNSFIPKK